ncbi:hypothetical protein Vlu01_25840 [Micromonospora lutea]|uniref:Uncharacterized protein n=1 Tax=Micromonospora lutea TaxID=419825 RepID=A0ABQ4IVK6_9ACTN|nr:hypothetical protein Vlu01_25840 [Micromonospora lutea]
MVTTVATVTAAPAAPSRNRATSLLVVWAMPLRVVSVVRADDPAFPGRDPVGMVPDRTTVPAA